MQDKDTYSVELDGRDYTLKNFPTYDAAENELFLIEGSCNTLEISLKNGSANDKLRVVIGQPATLIFNKVADGWEPFICRREQTIMAAGTVTTCRMKVATSQDLGDSLRWDIY